MSTTVDNRVVEMRFDNSNFESNVKESMSTLEKLKQALKFNEGTKGLDQVATAAKNVKFDGIETGVESLKNRFSTLGVVGMSVINNLTNTAMNLGKKLYSSTVGQVVQGGWQRASNIEQARFTLQGVLKDADKVKITMKEAMDSVDGTAYGFDQAALAASQFASSGVKNGDQMQHALAAVAGTAATTGKEYSWIAQIFTRVAGQGKVMATDLNSLASAGTNAAVELANFMNGVNNGSVEASDSIKKAVRSISTSTKLTEADIREFVRKGKISFDIFSEAMNNSFGEHAQDANKTFTGALANVQARLKQMGQKFFINYEDDGPLGILNENSPVVLFLNDLRKALTGLKDAIDPLAYSFREVVNTIAEAGSGFLKFFDTTEKTEKGITKNKEAMEMFQNVVFGFTNLVNGVWHVLESIGAAFAAAFPSVNIKTLNELSKSWVSFTSRLSTSKPLFTGIRNTFTGLFAVLRIAGTVIKNIWYILKPFVELLPWVSGGILGVTGSLSDQLVALADAFAKWDGLKNLMEKVSKPIERLGAAYQAFWDAAGGSLSISKEFERLRATLSVPDAIGETIYNTFAKIAKGIGAVYEAFTGKDISGNVKDLLVKFAGVSTAVSSFSGKLSKAAGEASKWFYTIKDFKNDMSQIAGVIPKTIGAITSAFAGAIAGVYQFIRSLLGLSNANDEVYIVYDKIIQFGWGVARAFEKMRGSGEQAKQFFSNLKQAFSEVLPSLSSVKDGFSNFGKTIVQVLKPVGKVLSTLGTLLKSFFDKLSFKTILGAGATGGLVAYFYNLQKIGSFATGMFKKFTGNLGEWSKKAYKYADVFDTTLSGFRSTLYKYQKTLDAKALTGIAAAVGVLALSLFVLSTIDPDNLSSATIAIGALFGYLVATMKHVNKFDLFGNLYQVAGVMVGMSIAVLLLASAVKKLSKIDPQGVLVGMLAIAGVMGSMALFIQRIPEKKLAGTAGALILVSVAVKVLAGAIKKLGKLSIGEVAQGLLAVGIALAEFAAFTHVISERQLGGLGGALITLSVGMLVLAKAVKSFGKMSIGEVAQGLLAVGIALAEFAAFTRVVKEGKLVSLGVALGVLSASMLILSKAVSALGSMQIGTISQGLLAVAIALASFAAFSRVVAGGKLIAGAAGIAAISGAFIALAIALERLTEFSWGELGKGLASIASALVAFTVFSKLIDPKRLIAGAIGMIVMSGAMTVMTGVVERLSAMSLGELARGLFGFATALLVVGVATNLMTGALAGAVSLVVVAAAMNLLVIPIEKLAKIKMGALVKALVGLAAGLTIIGVAGALLGVVSPLILAFGVALTTVGIAITAIGAGFFLIASAISVLATAMSNGLTAIVQGILMIANTIPIVATKIGEGILNIIMAVLNGADQVIAGLTVVGQKLIMAITILIPQVANLIGLLIVSILSTIDHYLPAIIEKAGSIITNFLYGMGIQMPQIVTAATFMIIMFMQGIANNLPTIVQAGFDIIGNLVQGLLNGLLAYLQTVWNAITNFGSNILKAFRSVLGINSPSTETYDIGVFTVEGFLNAIKDNEDAPAEEMSALGGNVLSALQGSASSGDFQEVGTDWLAGLTNGLNSGESGSSGEKAASDAAQGASSQINLFGDAGNDLMGQLVSGLDQTAPNASTSVANASQTAAQAVRPYQSQFVASGRYLMLGLVKGIREKAPDAAKAAADAGRSAVNALQSAIKQGSPSKLTYESGKFFDEGFINGIKSLTGRVGVAARHIGDKAFGEFNSAIDKIVDLMSIIPADDWAPTITPVVDLSNVVGSLSVIDDIFGATQNTIRLAEDTNLQMSANAIDMQDYGMKVNNEDVIQSIRMLSDDISDLKSTVKNLRMVMDTGAIVGELRDPMDKALGMKSRHISRGG